MADKIQLPYGQWPSRITPQNTGGLLELSEPAWDRNGTLFWRERNSTQGSIQMASPDNGEIISISGDMNVGGGLLYGGGSFGIGENWIYFIDKPSQQLWGVSPTEGNPIPLTYGLALSASPVVSPDSHAVLFVHSDGEQDAIYLLSKDGEQDPVSLISGGDFYNYPRWHPRGRQIAWISWNHPHMPWDSSTLWLGTLGLFPNEEPRLVSESLIAGGEGISVLQPEFSPDGRWLAYISDQSGWWQIHLYDLVTGEHRQLTEAPAEHALPPWLQNRNGYGFSRDSQKIYFTRNQTGIRSLWVWDLEMDRESRLELDENYTWLDWFSISPLEDRLGLIASAGDLPPRLITVDPSGKTVIIRQSAQEELPRTLFSLPQPISWKNQDRSEVQGLFYAPHNPDFQAEGLPPLLVIIHSGPTRQKSADYQARTQFFTSRGFAVLEVNYRGSSGYGRAYRQSLQKGWGVIDVEDCLSGALYVTEQGWADREKMALLGSSSGGLTVYQILVRYPGVFRVGIVLYGIVNQLDLLKNPSKFERHYSHWLIGPYPEDEKLYRERSPIFFADRIQDPIAVFQGGRDPIVPRNQADQIIQKLKKNNVTHLYVLYPDEGHGFKTAENIEDFYQQSQFFLENHLFREKGN
ncbi:MAG TPA: S9 family peptidase [Chloroflexi bacterium]|nr:S9 family peptidase [Chloroflexota bacterium]